MDQHAPCTSYMISWEGQQAGIPDVKRSDGVTQPLLNRCKLTCKALCSAVLTSFCSDLCIRDHETAFTGHVKQKQWQMFKWHKRPFRSCSIGAMLPASKAGAKTIQNGRLGALS